VGVHAAVVGASGYVGGELLRLLASHEDIDVTAVTAETRVGELIGEVHPQLPTLADQVLIASQPHLLSDAELIFLALPHGRSGAFAAQLPGDSVVVDLGADHRLSDPKAWSDYYSGPYAGSWQYGLPELGFRTVIAGSRRIAAPGCYPTAVCLGLAPLLSAGLVSARDIVITAASGTSGAGRSPQRHLLGSELMGSMTAYAGDGTHRHIPEIVQVLTAAAGDPAVVSFTPSLAPMPRGILASCTARLVGDASAGELREALEVAYGPEPFVRILPKGSWPMTGATIGSNSAHLQVAADHRSGRAVVVVALDNLGKGAAGQALQAANLALGLPETSGLSANGVAP
jgi:N-acetyl-gamma-glutamyl-phosphate reductase